MKWLANIDMNLLPVDADVNKLKGAGINKFLDMRTLNPAKANFTLCLWKAHQSIDSQILDNQDAKLGDVEVQSIQRERAIG